MCEMMVVSAFPRMDVGNSSPADLWRTAPTSPNDHADNNGQIHYPSRQSQDGELSGYDSENGMQETETLNRDVNRSSSSDENRSASHLFPITCDMYSNSENESCQASPTSSYVDEEGGISAVKCPESAKNSSAQSGTKSKIYKCKTCGFTSGEKQESYIHQEIHIKPEKILRCTEYPTCRFVTEYKHHMDFHVGNHKGIKPYKCDYQMGDKVCNYVCVNKSMLKSHQKSHSNVYQYSCANCSYRTKYCHSLKIHLRKYAHEPGMVLDSEGNPNPNPVIDVYGNRRGPKQKPKKPAETNANNRAPTLQGFSWANAGVFFENSALQCPPLLPNLMMNRQFMTNSSTSSPVENLMNNNNIFNLNRNTESPKTTYINCQPDIPSFLMKEETYNPEKWPFFPRERDSVVIDREKSEFVRNIIERNSSTFDFSHAAYDFDISENRIEEAQNVPLNLSVSHNSPPRETFSNKITPPNGFFANFSTPSNKISPHGAFLTVISSPRETLSNQISPRERFSTTFQQPRETFTDEISKHEEFLTDISTPLNKIAELFPSVISPPRERFSNTRSPPLEVTKPEIKTEPEETIVKMEIDSTVCSPPPVLPTKNRRKGIAVKLKRNSSVEDLKCVGASKKNAFFCEYCEISFVNEIMYTMHMGYHGYLDPFTCNRCGKKSPDKIEFYAHLISSAHG